ncbi:MAG: TolC family protein [Acidobacteria bacterium]|nr:TolC family protein [Acidobacteriota bacterium]MCW5969479.1 TolC family protein [Blastocatellales bacterium]
MHYIDGSKNSVYFLNFRVFCVLSVLIFMFSATAPAQTSRLTLAEIASRARVGHPMIISARQRVAALEGERLEAGLRPNPQLTISGENFPLEPPQNGFSFNRTLDWFATYTHTFETAGKRGLRVAAADRSIEAAIAEAESVERRVVFEVKASYRRAAIAQARTALLRTSLDQLGQLVMLNEARVREGYTAEGELIKTRLEAQRFEMQLRRATLDAERAKVQLLQAAGAISFTLRDTDFELDERIDYEPVSLNPQTLEEAALRQPLVRRAASRVEAAHALVLLERARARPDITFTAGYKRNSVDNAMFGAMTVPLPIYSRNRGSIARAEADEAAAEAELRFVRSSVLAELAMARLSFETYRQQIESMRAGFLRDADATQQITLAAYREGAVDLLVLLDAQRSRGQAQELWLQALEDYQIAVHELERVAGIEQLPRITSTARAAEK